MGRSPRFSGSIDGTSISSGLIAYQRTRTAEKPYVFVQCWRGFSDLSSQSKHEDTQDKHHEQGVFVRLQTSSLINKSNMLEALHWKQRWLMLNSKHVSIHKKQMFSPQKQYTQRGGQRCFLIHTFLLILPYSLINFAFTSFWSLIFPPPLKSENTMEKSFILF